MAPGRRRTWPVIAPIPSTTAAAPHANATLPSTTSMPETLSAEAPTEVPPNQSRVEPNATMRPPKRASRPGIESAVALVRMPSSIT